MEIPWQTMDSETLDRLLSELVTRDGTDYGRHEQTTAQKITAARRSLEKGRACLMWDAELESASLVPIEQVREAEKQYLKDAEAVGLEATKDGEKTD